MQKIALIQSCWHKDIVDQFRISFLKNMQSKAQSKKVEVIEAPGVVEIPLLSKLCAKKRVDDKPYYSAIVVAGLIVDHGVYRHEFVVIFDRWQIRVLCAFPTKTQQLYN